MEPVRKIHGKVLPLPRADDPCPDGALVPFNIDAKLNGAYVALGVLYGRKDFAKTLEIATRSGQDSDCNPSSAPGTLGVMVGYRAIPETFKSGIPPLADTKFQFTNYSFNEICKSTLDRALKVIRAAGGTVAAQEVTIPAQPARAAALEQNLPDPLLALGALNARGGKFDQAVKWQKRASPAKSTRPTKKDEGR